jgi:hypothetical protein
MNYTCFSGGAQGADLVWEIESIKHNIKVIAYSFDGHNTKSSNTYILSANQLKEGFKHIEIANKRLNRNIYNISQYVKNLISRDYYQVKNSDTIFAIGRLQTENTVMGGTGYACSVAIDLKKQIYLFEQNDNQWYYYDYETDRFEIFEEIPKLTEKFAGIGTREINNNGINAIIKLFEKNSLYL